MQSSLGFLGALRCSLSMTFKGIKGRIPEIETRLLPTALGIERGSVVIWIVYCGQSEL